MAVRVLAEYVTLKVQNPVAGVHYRGYLKDSIVEGVEAESLKHHLDLGMVEVLEETPDPGELADETAPDPEPSVEETPVLDRPAGNASQEAWATYATESGQASEDEVKGLSRDDLRELYG